MKTNEEMQKGDEVQKIGRREMCQSLLFGSLMGVTALAQERRPPSPSSSTAPVLDAATEDERIQELVKRGATMEEIAKAHEKY